MNVNDIQLYSVKAQIDNCKFEYPTSYMEFVRIIIKLCRKGKASYASSKRAQKYISAMYVAS